MGLDHSLSPEPYFSKTFVHACHTGELIRVQEFLASGRVTAEDLDRGLGAATRQAHAEIVATLFDAGANVSDWAMAALHGRSKQDLPVIRLFLDHALDRLKERQRVRKPKRGWCDTPGHHSPEQVDVVVAGPEGGREDNVIHILVAAHVHGVLQADPLDEPNHRIHRLGC